MPKKVGAATNRKLTDRDFMLRAIELAKKCVTEPGRKTPSPKVGAVIARDGVRLGEAYRGELEPGEHCEFTLLEKKLSGETLAGATLYTTLEPCSSRNDPKIGCALRVIERRVGKVFIGALDRNPTIRGNGELQLLDAGIQVARFDPDLIPILEEMNRDFLRSFKALQPLSRTPIEMTEPVGRWQVGPSGHRIGYTEDGDKVELIPDEKNPGQVIPLLLRRNDRQIVDTYARLVDRVFLLRARLWQEEETRKGEDPDDPLILRQTAGDFISGIEKKRGWENVQWNLEDYNVTLGSVMALSWVLGNGWDDFEFFHLDGGAHDASDSLAIKPTARRRKLLESP